MCTRHLCLRGNPSSSSSSSPIITIEEKLQLLFNLETLTVTRMLIFNIAANQLMNMVGIEQQQQRLGSCFQNLSKIETFNCNALKDLTWVGYVPNLKILEVGGCKELEEIVVIVVVDDLGGGSTAGAGNEIIFKSLKTLRMIQLPKLKSPELKKLPLDYGSNVNNTLQKIQGAEEWWNELRWEEEDHDNNELLKSKFLPYFL